jgi:hypothetical protein
MGMGVGDQITEPVDNWDRSKHTDAENATAATVKWILSKLLSPSEREQIARSIPYWWE